jgi:hypothetical protein
MIKAIIITVSVAAFVWFIRGIYMTYLRLKAHSQIFETVKRKIKEEL